VGRVRRAGQHPLRRAGPRHFVHTHTREPAPVPLYVGRFLEFKHVPLIVRAYARARPSFEAPASAVIWSGFPGEFGARAICDRFAIAKGDAANYI
jgi:hypothetical protein